MWFGSSFACKWGLCANTCYVNVFLRRPEPRVCLCCVWNEDHHQEGWELFTSQKNTPPTPVPSPPTLLLLSCLQTNRPHLIFSSLVSFQHLCDGTLSLCCDCAVRVTSLKRWRGDHVSAGRKEAGVFSHSSDSPGRSGKHQRLALACARSQTSQQLFFSCSFVFLRDGVQLARAQRNQSVWLGDFSWFSVRLLTHMIAWFIIFILVKGKHTVHKYFNVTTFKHFQSFTVESYGNWTCSSWSWRHLSFGWGVKRQEQVQSLNLTLPHYKSVHHSTIMWLSYSSLVLIQSCSSLLAAVHLTFSQIYVIIYCFKLLFVICSLVLNMSSR